MERHEFLRQYANLPLKLRHKPLFLFRHQGIAWHDIYFELWQNKGDKLLKIAEKKGLLKDLTKQSNSLTRD